MKIAYLTPLFFLAALPAQGETAQDFAALLRTDQIATDRTVPKASLDRITTAVPWPRGLAIVGDKLVVLARGRHRRAGGVDLSIQDHCGALFEVDLNVSEAVVPGKLASDAVRNNGRPIVGPSKDVFHLYVGKTTPIEDTLMDRPYCTLVHDPASQNFFICGYSGVDLPGAKFRKNATDSIHRYDTRTKKWYRVEMHDPAVVPKKDLGFVVSNAYYPHHDPNKNAPPHGWLNGPDGACVTGDILYVVGKDNHTIAAYDLTEIRKNPGAGTPKSWFVMDQRISLKTKDGIKQVELMGSSAVEVHEGYLYVGYRTSSVVVRYPVDKKGRLVRPIVGELIAIFEPWCKERRRSANLIDITFNQKGELFVSCAKEGKVWMVGRPDPDAVFFGNDQDKTRKVTAPPLLHLRKHTGKKTNTGNIVFDSAGRLYLCSGNYDTSSKIAGVIYRATIR